MKILNEKEALIANKILEIMQLLNIEDTSDNSETPARVALMLNRELFSNVNQKELPFDVTVFENPSDSRQLIKIKDIPFYSMCEHHWMPFFGKCDIEYIAGDVILGLSKFPRVVDFFSRQPQVQERLTEDIGMFLSSVLKPVQLKVTLHDVTHTCVTMRGIKSDCTTDTVFNYN